MGLGAQRKVEGLARFWRVPLERRVGLSLLEEFIKCEANVFGYLTEQDWRDVSALMKWNRCAATCRITKLFVRTALADFGETELDENGDYFIGLENGSIAHSLSDCDVLNPNKLGLQHGFAIFQKH